MQNRKNKNNSHSRNQLPPLSAKIVINLLKQIFTVIISLILIITASNSNIPILKNSVAALGRAVKHETDFSYAIDFLSDTYNKITDFFTQEPKNTNMSTPETHEI